MTQQKLRGWATVWRVETADGVVVRQAELPRPADRAAADGRARPAVARPGRPGDRRPSDGFLLTPDQGDVFYETAGDDLENWVRLAREAALLQRELVPAPRRAAGRSG